MVRASLRTSSLRSTFLVEQVTQGKLQCIFALILSPPESGTPDKHPGHRSGPKGGAISTYSLLLAACVKNFRRKNRFHFFAFHTSNKTSMKSLLLLLPQLVVIAIAQTSSSQLRTSLVSKKSQNFLLDGVELNLSSDEVAADFCDSASPLSLAGYMNGEFLS
jgi:hypothetical protein